MGDPLVKKNSEVCRALVAVGLTGSVVVLGVEGEYISREVACVGDHAEEVGLFVYGRSPGCGIWVWEGQFRYVTIGLECDPDVEVRGTIRPATTTDIENLLGKIDKVTDEVDDNGWRDNR